VFSNLLWRWFNSSVLATFILDNTTVYSKPTMVYENLAIIDNTNNLINLKTQELFLNN
jgi:hypothetical protein